jgi:hypothetical protein
MAMVRVASLTSKNIRQLPTLDLRTDGSISRGLDMR